jgi:hypothetical protein
MTSRQRHPGWVHWFVNGRAESFPADSITGRSILAKLADFEGAMRPCAAPGCSRSIDGRASQKFCSKACGERARRGSKRGLGTRTAQPSIRATRRPASSQLDDRAESAVIAHTAHDSSRPARRCANCGTDISDKRADAKVCGNSCRMALARRAAAMVAAAELSDLLGAEVES